MKDLHITVVGAGIGGLQTALSLSASNPKHKITVLESAPSFEEVGAGIRVSPNSSRLSRSWGVDFNRILDKLETSLGNRFVDWQGHKLLDVPFADVKERYGAPYYFVHRADFVKLLVQTCAEKSNITIRNRCRVEKYDFSAPSVTLSSGETLLADLVVAADGIKSSVRDQINGREVAPQDTGDVAYRILVPAKLLLEDPSMAHLVREAWATHWMGPEGHAVGYPLRGGELYNIIVDVTHGSDVGERLPEDGQIWRSVRSCEELVERFREWCPEVKNLCGMAGEYLKWKLADFDELERWVHPDGKVVLLGDACHPMMPYMAQGAAQATEDAASLAACLSSSQHTDIQSALLAYERVRKPRAAYVARNTRVLQDWLHLYDGPAKDERDRLMLQDSASNPIFWGHTARKDWLFGHDASNLESCTSIPLLPPRPATEWSVYSREGETAS